MVTEKQDARGQCREVAAALTALPYRQRAALVQRQHHRLTYAEIASNLHCSPAEARASVYAAMRTLRDQLGDQI